MTISSSTSDFNIAYDVMKKTPLLSLKLKWDWKEFEWLYVFEFNGVSGMYIHPDARPLVQNTEIFINWEDHVGI